MHSHFQFWGRLALLGGLLISGWRPAAGAVTSFVQGKNRFRVLAPGLVRLEHSPSGVFVDVPSAAVVGRDWPEVAAQSVTNEGWLEITTAKLKLRYKADSGAFTPANLVVTWKDAQGDHAWKPGDKDDQNLGGVVGDIAIRSTPVTDPGMLSRRGWFLLDDSHTALWDEASQWVKPRTEKGGQDLYFFVYGHDYAGMLKMAAGLLGPVPMPPRFVLGAWFGSRCGYAANQWQLIVDRYREEGLPLDMLIMDSCSWTSVVWSGYDIDREQLPDPQGFLAWMKAHGIRTSFNEHFGSLTKQNDRNFDKMREIAGLPPDANEVPHNLANKAYARAFMDLLHKPLLDMGMAFWWQDGAAPANMEGLDPMMWTRQVEYDGQERLTGKRSFVFCRLGAWGSHRSGGFFSSDLIPQWNTLSLIVPFTEQGGNMLVPYVVNLCTAVYGVNVEPELYHRWVQFSAFSPIFWFHGLWGMRLPWEYGPGGIELYRKYLGLRYRLLPYTYTNARIAHDSALPLVRGMYLMWPDQEAAYHYTHQYMFGGDLLVAPVTEPGYGEAVTKDVYLPAGTDWYDFHTGRIHRGGQVLPYVSLLDQLPLLVRAGAIVPLGPRLDYTDQRPLEDLTFEVYNSDKGAAFQLYEDDGISLDFRTNAFARTEISLAPQGADQVLTIAPSSGNFTGQAEKRAYEFRFHGLLKPEAVELNGQAIPEKREGEEGLRWRWDVPRRVTIVRLPDALSVRQPLALTLKNAGSYAEALVLQKVVEFRDRVRRAKHEEKLKYAVLDGWGGGEHDKPPRVIRETEAVETQLNELVANLRGLAANPPDFKAMTARLLTAFTQKPFEVTRTIPTLNESSRSIGEVIQRGAFEPAELRKLTGILLGCELAARTVWDAPAFHTAGPYLHVRARLDYERDAIGPAQVRYELEMPEEAGGRSWAAGAPAVNPLDAYCEYGIMHPHPSVFGPHTFRVKAILSWEGGSTEVAREMVWHSTALP